MVWNLKCFSFSLYFSKILQANAILGGEFHTRIVGDFVWVISRVKNGSSLTILGQNSQWDFTA